jgi:hypothetical protein
LVFNAQITANCSEERNVPVFEEVVSLSCFSNLSRGQGRKADPEIIFPGFELLTHYCRLSFRDEEKLLTLTSRRKVGRERLQPKRLSLAVGGLL